MTPAPWYTFTLVIPDPHGGSPTEGPMEAQVVPAVGATVRPWATGADHPVAAVFHREVAGGPGGRLEVVVVLGPPDGPAASDSSLFDLPITSPLGPG